jgi:DNA-binding transcriptional MerR regulator
MQLPEGNMAITKKQIAETLGRPIRTITYWTDANLVHLDDAEDRKAGRARKFAERNLIEFAMVDVMTKRGIEIKAVKTIMDAIQPDAGIEDFFGNSKWGLEKELAYLEWDNVDGRQQKIAIISDDKDMLSFVGINPINPKIVARIVWIGQVKQQALKLLSE